VQRPYPNSNPHQKAKYHMSVVLTEEDFAGAYGSQHVSAEEIGDRRLKWTVSHVEKTTMPAREGKPAKDRAVLHFEGQKKTLVLNTTNYNMLRAAVSRHPGEWVGAALGVYTEWTSFGGKPIRGIRLKVVKLPDGITPAGGAPAAAAAEMDDEVPF
jgi:hypothetical protein